MIVLNKDGDIIDSWALENFSSAHHVEIGPDDSVWTTDVGNHTVRKWTSDGNLLLTLGSPDNPAPEQSGETFSIDLPISPSDLMDHCMSPDGYGNSRIHHFTPEGKLNQIMGRKGYWPRPIHGPT
ncbi:MAG: hypothetical protein CM1200mP3_16610 [Chloroflexota bacterium]|nr:MAG: hypothetical protein CM1200mP3_16610 [Chloroflexota bacterium]